MAQSCQWVSNIKMSMLLKKRWFTYVEVSLKQDKYHIYMTQLPLQSLYIFSIGITLVDVHLNWLNQLVPLSYSLGRSNYYSDRLHDFSVTISKCYKDVYVKSFFPPTVRLWNSLPIECFPLNYDLSGFKSRINRFPLCFNLFVILFFLIHAL